MASSMRTLTTTYSHLETTHYIIFGDWYLMAAFARQHLLPFGNYTLHYLVDPSLERMGSDKKNKGIGSRETRDCDPGSSLRASLAIFVYMEIVARRARTKATDATDLYIFNRDGEHVFDCSVEQTDHSVEQKTVVGV
jgi:hypothetical protein